MVPERTMVYSDLHIKRYALALAIVFYMIREHQDVFPLYR